MISGCLGPKASIGLFYIFDMINGLEDGWVNKKWVPIIIGLLVVWDFSRRSLMSVLGLKRIFVD